ncbi:hypothetical protein EMIT0347P_80081 [Pseudomonas sp. IT-347P]
MFAHPLVKRTLMKSYNQLARATFEYRGTYSSYDASSRTLCCSIRLALETRDVAARPYAC